MTFNHRREMLNTFIFVLCKLLLSWLSTSHNSCKHFLQEHCYCRTDDLSSCVIVCLIKPCASKPTSCTASVIVPKVYICLHVKVTFRCISFFTLLTYFYNSNLTIEEDVTRVTKIFIKCDNLYTTTV